MLNRRMIKWAAFIAVAITLTVVGLKIYKRWLPDGRNELLKSAIPKDAAFFFEISNLKNAGEELKKHNYLDGFSDLSPVKMLSDYLSTLKPLTDKSAAWSEALYNHTIISSYHLVSQNKYDLVLLLDFTAMGEPDFDGQLALSENYAAVRNFKGEKIYEVNFQLKKNISFAFVNDVCVISSTASLVEDAVSQLTGRTNLLDDKSFKDLEKLMQQKFDVTFYCNYKNLSDFFQGFSNASSADYLKTLPSFAGWSGFDLSFDENEIKVHGYSTPSSQTNFLSQFDATGNLSGLFADAVPDVAAFVMSESISSTSVFEKNNPDLQTESDYRRYIKPWLGNEIDFVLTEPVNNNFLPQSFIVFGGVKKENAEETLRQFALIKWGGDSSALINYKSNLIMQLKVDSAFSRYFPNALVKIKTPFCCVYSSSVIVANSLGQMKMYLDKLMDKSTMPLSIFQKSFVKNSQYSFNINPSRIKDFVQALASDELKKTFSSQFDIFKKCNLVLLPFNDHGNYFETTGNISFAGGNISSENYAWKTELDTAALTAPNVMFDAEGNKIVFIQDARLQLYCLNKGGEIMWKRTLDSKVMGKIFQIDLYSNGDCQYVLNTSGGIYLFGKDGKDINNFPVRLAAEAVAPLSMLDFDGRRQFKFFVPCSNGCIYGFEKSGKPLGGWNPNSGNGIIRNPIQFFHAGKSEFLAAADENGKILLFTREGKKSGKDYKSEMKIVPPFLIGKRNQLMAMDSTGNIFELSIDGKTRHYFLFNDDAIASQMIQRPDTTVQVLLLYTDKLVSMLTDSTLIFNFSFQNFTASGMKLFVDESNSEIYSLVMDVTQNKLLLINAAGKPVSGFPKSGSELSVLSDLFQNGGQVLLTVQNGNELVAYGVEVR